MKHLKILFALLLLTTLNINAQGLQKSVVAIYPFSSTTDYQTKQHKETIYQIVESAFVKTKRFSVVERSKLMSTLQKELQTQEVMSEDALETGKLLGAKYVVTGHVQAISSVPIKNDDGKTTGYKANVTYVLKVLDVETSQILNTQTISRTRNTSFGGYGGDDKAINNAINSTSFNVEKWIDINFPVSFPVYKITEEHKKKGAKMLEIIGGADFGMRKGELLRIMQFETIEYNGKKITKNVELGRIRIYEVQGNEFSSCKVVKGGEEILKAFKKNPKSIFAVTGGKKSDVGNLNFE